MSSGMKYTPEFRAAAVAEVLATSRPIKDVASELSIRTDTLQDWVHWSEKAVEMTKKNGGGFNRSSQHFMMMEVTDGTAAAVSRRGAMSARP